MLEQYKTVYEGGIGEIIEKKSRFICTVQHVECEEEAWSFIEEMKKNIGMPLITVMHTRWGKTESTPDAVMTVSLQEQQEGLCWM